MSDKIGQFTIVPLLTRNLEHAEYVRRTTEEIKRLNIPKKPASTIQCASTQRTLERDPKKDAEWQARPLPESTLLEAKINKAAYEDGDLDELERLLGTRKLKAEEVLNEELRRRKPKNSLGQSDKDGAEQISIEKAVNAYLYSPPAELTEHQREKLTEVQAYSELPTLVKEVTKPRLRRLSLLEKTVLIGAILFFLTVLPYILLKGI